MKIVVSSSSTCMAGVTYLTLDGDLFALEVVHVPQQHLFPVAAITDEAQI